ncbi:flagellar motor switch protein FliN [Nocardioides zeae]
MPLSIEELLAHAATAAADALPSAVPLSAGPAQLGNEHVAASFAGAAVADVTGQVAGGGRIAVLVAADLVEALAASPLGGLDLGAAVQAALDAAATALGTAVGAARTVDASLVVSDLGAPFQVVPLIGAGIAGALLVPTPVLDAAVAATAAPATPAPAAPPAAVPAGVGTGGSAFGGASAPAAAPAFGGAPAATGTYGAPARGIEMLHGVDLEVTVELGRTRLTVRDLLALAPGTVLELDRAAGSPADLLVNGRLIARGEVVVVDEDFGLRVTEIVDDATNA